VATSITPNRNTRGSKRPKEGITVTTSPLKRRKKVVTSRAAQRGGGGAKGAIWRAPVILGVRAVIFGGDGQSFFWQKNSGFWAKYHTKIPCKKERNEKVVDGDVGGGGDEGSPPKIFLGPLKSSGQPWFLVAVTVQ
jgi:hypothetical protein